MMPYRLREMKIFRRRVELIAVQIAAIIRNGSTFFVPCLITEWSAILCVALNIIAAMIGCNARKLALKYLFLRPAKVYK